MSRTYLPMVLSFSSCLPASIFLSLGLVQKVRVWQAKHALGSLQCSPMNEQRTGAPFMGGQTTLKLDPQSSKTRAYSFEVRFCFPFNQKDPKP